MIINIAIQMAAVKREIQRRKDSYPSKVSAGKLSQAISDIEIAAMEAVLATLHEFESEHEDTLMAENRELRKQLKRLEQQDGHRSN